MEERTLQLCGLKKNDEYNNTIKTWCHL